MRGVVIAAGALMLAMPTVGRSEPVAVVVVTPPSQRMVEMQGSLGQAASSLGNVLNVGQGNAIADAGVAGVGLVPLIGLSAANSFTGSGGLQNLGASTYTWASHDGYRISSDTIPDGTFGQAAKKTTDFELQEYSIGAGGRWDVTQATGLVDQTLVIGLFGSYTETEIKLGEYSDWKAALGFDLPGRVDSETWNVGGYALLTQGPAYGLLIVSGAWGTPEVRNFVLNSKTDYQSTGVMVSAFTGMVMPTSATAKVDFRVGLSWLGSEGEDHHDTKGHSFSNQSIEDTSFSASVRLIEQWEIAGTVVRPFGQIGMTQRLDYSNEVSINAHHLEFDDADTFAFGRAGVDFSLWNNTAAFVAVRGDMSDDIEVVSGQAGLTFLFD